MVTIWYSESRNGTPLADVRPFCPMCDRRSHYLAKGMKKVKAIKEYYTDRINHKTQDLPFEIPVREFLKSGYCKTCLKKMFGVTSNKIVYLKERR